MKTIQLHCSVLSRIVQSCLNASWLAPAIAVVLSGVPAWPVLAQVPKTTQDVPAQNSSTLGTTSRGTSYWSDTWRGWFFYEDPEPEDIDASTVRPSPPLPAPVKQIRTPRQPVKPAEVAEFEQLQKALETSRQVAIMRPTEANVRHYMLLEAQVVTQASVFANVAQRIAWSTPDLDPTLHGRPVNAKALEVFESQQQGQRSSSVQSLAQDHVLLFFFRSDCPYCHAFAPTLEAFQRRYGLQVVAISVDGGTLPGFTSARRDNGIARALQVTQVPAVYLAQPYTGRITPIGFGVLSESQLLERITLVTSQPMPGLDESLQAQASLTVPSASMPSASAISFNAQPPLLSRTSPVRTSSQGPSALGTPSLISTLRSLK